MSAADRPVFSLTSWTKVIPARFTMLFVTAVAMISRLSRWLPIAFAYFSRSGVGK